eukprot:TRINITY_DN13885_c0_g1_i3.p1 TRINITY_DN13885_c0_g1~~TRINITY_DN13885_c0_g1_i3.p1  ORF type:complete len:280 (-),score=66.81 TRINITY_DN13885_c0_g1_i3:38-877(-)
MKSASIQYRCTEESKPFHPPLTESVALVMVEPVRRPGISQAAESVISSVNTSWPLYFFYAPSSQDPTFLDMIMKLNFVSIAKKQNRKIYFQEVEERFYKKSQNLLAFSKTFWLKIREEKIFFFHSDSAYCHPQASFPYKLEDFLYFDFVGAPWATPLAFIDSYVFVGNGGFTIRSKQLMLDCIDEMAFLPTPEDCYFAYCNTKRGKFAGKELAQHFAIEGSEPGEMGTLGIHGFCSYRKGRGCDKYWVREWIETCPASSFLFPDGRCDNCLWYNYLGIN